MQDSWTPHLPTICDHSLLFGCSEFAGLLAAVHLSVFVRDLQWSAESSYVLRPLHLAGPDQRRPQPLDLLHDADVSTTSRLVRGAELIKRLARLA